MCHFVKFRPPIFLVLFENMNAGRVCRERPLGFRFLHRLIKLRGADGYVYFSRQTIEYIVLKCWLEISFIAARDGKRKKEKKAARKGCGKSVFMNGARARETVLSPYCCLFYSVCIIEEGSNATTRSKPLFYVFFFFFVRFLPLAELN